MYEIDLKHIGTFIIVLGVILRPYIFKKFNLQGGLYQVLYFVLFMIIVVPLNMYSPKFTLTSLDKNTALTLTQNLLDSPLFLEKYKKDLDSLEWKPYNVEKKLYNIKVTLYKDSKPYTLYIQPRCDFLKGCEMDIRKIMLVDETHASIPIEELTEESFNTRACNDKIVEELLNQRIKFIMQTYFDKLKKDTTGKLDYELKFVKSLKHQIRDYPLNKKVLTHLYSKNRLIKRCQAKFNLEMLLKLDEDKEKSFYMASSILFDDVVKEDDTYKISSKIDYNIYLNNEGILVFGLPFKTDITKKVLDLSEEVTKNENNSTENKYTIIKDKKNHLVWSNLSFSKKELELSSQNKNYEKVGNFDYAVRYCSEQSYDGFTDWRLPTKKEFKTIIDKNNPQNNYFKKRFKHTYSETYWTSATDKRNELWGWGISMQDEGELYLLKKSHSSLIMCIRGE